MKTGEAEKKEGVYQKPHRGNYAMVAVKHATYAIFKQKAISEGKTLAGYFEDLSLRVQGNQDLELLPKTPQEQVMGELKEMNRKIDWLMTQVTDNRDFIDAIDSALLFQKGSFDPSNYTLEVKRGIESGDSGGGS